MPTSMECEFTHLSLTTLEQLALRRPPLTQNTFDLLHAQPQQLIRASPAPRPTASAPLFTSPGFVCRSSSPYTACGRVLMRLYVCMYMRLYVCVYVCICVCMYVMSCIYVCIHACMCACVCICNGNTIFSLDCVLFLRLLLSVPTTPPLSFLTLSVPLII